MPIITFHGLPEERVKKYCEQVEDICDLIKANQDNVFFVIATDKIINTKKSAYVTVEWMQRENKEQLFADHIREFFSNDVERIGVFFTDVNGKLYLDGNKLG